MLNLQALNQVDGDVLNLMSRGRVAYHVLRRFVFGLALTHKKDAGGGKKRCERDCSDKHNELGKHVRTALAAWRGWLVWRIRSSFDHQEAHLTSLLQRHPSNLQASSPRVS